MKERKTISAEEAFNKYAFSKVGARDLKKTFAGEEDPIGIAKTEFTEGVKARSWFRSMKEARSYFRDLQEELRNPDAFRRREALSNVFSGEDLRHFNRQFQNYKELEDNIKQMKLTDSGSLALDYEIAGYFTDTIKDGQVLAKVYIYYSGVSPVASWKLIDASEVGL